MRLKRFKSVTLLLSVFTHSSPHYLKPLLKEHIYAKQKGTTVPFKITQNEARDLSFADEHAFNLAWLFLMMGTFHILLMFLGMTGTRFKDAGMYIQSEIVVKRVCNIVWTDKSKSEHFSWVSYAKKGFNLFSQWIV